MFSKLGSFSCLLQSLKAFGITVLRLLKFPFLSLSCNFHTSRTQKELH